MKKGKTERRKNVLTKLVERGKMNIAPQKNGTKTNKKVEKVLDMMV